MVPRNKQEKNQTPSKILLRLRVNGEIQEVATEINKTLLEVLREDMGLTGTKHGCELGECGTCAVLVDGAPVLSCLMLGVEAVNTEIVTVEGMTQDGRPHPLQKTFADLGAAQCGYCIPGILLTAKALLDKTLAADSQRDSPSLVRKSLPLHRLYQNFASCRAGREGNCSDKTLGPGYDCEKRDSSPEAQNDNGRFCRASCCHPEHSEGSDLTRVEDSD